jgi:hypothetical protein
MESYECVLCFINSEKCITMIIHTQRTIGWTKTMPAKCHCSVLLGKLQGCTLKRKVYMYSYMDVFIPTMMSSVRRDKSIPIQIPTVPCDAHTKASWRCANLTPVSRKKQVSRERKEQAGAYRLAQWPRSVAVTKLEQGIWSTGVIAKQNMKASRPVFNAENRIHVCFTQDGRYTKRNAQV